MASINTNPSAMTALQSLHVTNKALAVVQGRISTGLRVAEAKDNAAYWSIATTMRSDNKVLATVQDTLGLGASRVDTAYTALESTLDLVSDMRQKILAAIGKDPSGKDQIQQEISAIQAQLESMARSATFSGQNWLAVNASETNGHPAEGVHRPVEIVSSFSRGHTGAIELGMIEIDVDRIKLYDDAATTNETKGLLEGLRLASTGKRDDTAEAPATPGADAEATDGYAVASLSVSGYSDDQLKDMLSVVDATLKEMTDAATSIGAAKKRIDLQKDFGSNLMDSIDRGVGQLVDADMNKESTRLQALQVQQQLGIQSLSIANSNAQNILSLFRQ
ncbi:flagellin [Mesorhizobium sp. CAU 1732]|uniref:flagellin N-terminal helical domain-containing protein n=1 Tax=Mesorhizobium sp. CAU 1732 TaxID=3140358 RepID=UPI00326032DD